MMFETISKSPGPQPAGKPFPRWCDSCRKNTVWPVQFPFCSQIRHDGVLHSVDTPELVVPRCQECGELYFDNHAEEQVSSAFAPSSTFCCHRRSVRTASGSA